jgi:hypothetical protein
MFNQYISVMDVKRLLVAFSLVLSINCFSQNINADFLKGGWSGFDAKYERVSFWFIDGKKLQITTISQKMDVQYALKQVSKAAYLHLSSNTKYKTAFAIHLISNDSIAVEYPNGSSHGLNGNFIILKRTAQASVSMLHWCMRVNDSTYEHGRALLFKNDSIVTRRTSKTKRYVNTERDDDTSNVDVTWLLPKEDTVTVYRDSFTVANLNWYPLFGGKTNSFTPTLTYEKEGEAYLFFWDEAEDGNFIKSLDKFIHYSRKHPAIEAKSYMLEGKWGPVLF